MNQAFFVNNFGGGNEICSCRECASHPLFIFPSTKPYGNSDRGFSTSLPQECFSCDQTGSFTLSDYNSTHWNGCSPPSTSSDASTQLSLTYKTVCRKVFKLLKKGFGVLASMAKSVYVMLCYVIMLLIIYLSIYLEVIVFKSYGIQERMLCCRQNIARYHILTG